MAMSETKTPVLTWPQINLMQGRIDLKFRMHGDKGDGTVYFTSIRPQQSAPWRIVRYKLIADNGEQLRLEDKFTKNPSPEPASAPASSS